MKINQTTKFLKSRRQTKCPDCGDDLDKIIRISLKSPFDDETYVSNIILWEYQDDVFRLSDNIFDKYPILNHNSVINSLSDIKNHCIYLQKLEYQICNIDLVTSCVQCDFEHSIFLSFIKNKLSISSENIQFKQFTINCSIAKNTSKITYPNRDGKHITYPFDYIIKINISNYKNLQSQIEKILLLR